MQHAIHKHLSDFFLPCSQLVNAIVRPPRAEYEIQELGPARFEYGKVPFVRQDGTITNPRGHTLVTSFWRRADLAEPAPCTSRTRERCFQS